MNFEEWKKIGVTVKDIYEKILHEYIAISKKHGKTSRRARNIYVALKALEKARGKLDSYVCEEYKDDLDAMIIFYGKASELMKEIIDKEVKMVEA